MTSRSTPIIKHSCPTLGEEEANAAAEVIRSGDVANGKKCSEFENMLAEHFGVKHAAIVNSGTTALFLSLMATDSSTGWPRSGSESRKVLIPAYSCPSLAYAVRLAGDVPVFVDADVNGNINLRNMQPGIMEEVALILAVNTFGIPVSPRVFQAGVPVLEDCTMSIGKIGGMVSRDIGICSFYATKMLCTGEGGVILSNDATFTERVKRLRSPEGPIHRTEPRGNYKMTDIQAAIGIEQLKKLPEFVERRSMLALHYDNLLRNFVKTPSQREVYHRYVVQVQDRDAIMKYMHDHGVICGRGVLESLHEECERATWLCDVSLSLPIYPSLTYDQATYVATTLIEAVRQCG